MKTSSQPIGTVLPTPLRAVPIATMNDEEAFQAALDANPEDHTTRLVFADWLEERGDVRAEGYRALGFLELQPWLSAEGWGWFEFGWCSNPDDNTRPSQLPPGWCKAMSCTNRAKGGEQFRTRREAEDAAALAFAGLPEARRAELLAGAGER